MNSQSYCISVLKNISHRIWAKKDVLNLSCFVAHTFPLLSLPTFHQQISYHFGISLCSIKITEFSSLLHCVVPRVSLKLMDKERNTSRLLTVFRSLVKAVALAEMLSLCCRQCLPAPLTCVCASLCGSLCTGTLWISLWSPYLAFIELLLSYFVRK